MRVRGVYSSSQGLAVYFRDITERRRLQDLSERLAAIVASSNDAIIGKDLDGVITSWNHAAERMFGYGAEEIIGRSINALIPAGRQDEEMRILQRLRLGERVPERELRVAGDRERLRQVVVNLLSNAVKYGRAPGEIWVCGEENGPEAVLRVRDDGVGIPQEALHTIFELFEQVPRSLGESREGLGLGLSLVRGLVEMHGGGVSAWSAGPGQGSEFTVSLPLIGGQAREGGARDGR